MYVTITNIKCTDLSLWSLTHELAHPPNLKICLKPHADCNLEPPDIIPRLETYQKMYEAQSVVDAITRCVHCYIRTGCG